MNGSDDPVTIEHASMIRSAPIKHIKNTEKNRRSEFFFEDSS